MKRWAYIATIVFGIVLVAGAIGTWVVVSTTLSNQRITVADDAKPAIRVGQVRAHVRRTRPG